MKSEKNNYLICTDLAHEAKRCSQSDLLESEGMIDGVDVSAYFEPSNTSAAVVGETNDDLEFNEPLERFMRNEIAYNEFMQMTGNVILYSYFGLN